MRPERFWRRLDEYRAAGQWAAARTICHTYLQDADDAGAWLALSSIEQASGAYRRSRAAAEGAAVSLRAPANATQLARVALRLLEFNEVERARATIVAADWNAPDVLRQSPALVQQLWLAGDDEAALRLAEHARDRIAPNARLEYACGLVCRDTGAIAAAQAAFEHAVRIDPTFAATHWSLAYMAPKGAARIERIRDVLSKPVADVGSAIDLQYALFKEHEAAGDTESAWNALASGARMKHGTLAPGLRDRDYATLAEAPGRALPAPDASGIRPIVFIVGMPRTGTTVVERILGNHSAMQAAGELQDFHAALCFHHDRFLDLPMLCRGYEDLRAHEDVGARYRASVRRFGADGKGLIDKNPANFVYAGLIAESLPEARIICLVRDPMDACFSNLKELFSGDAYPYSYDLRQLADYYGWFERTRQRFEAALPGRFMSVDYRGLVADPAAAAARILEFCGLPHEPGCDRIERNRSRVSTASSAQVREPIHERFVDAWTRYREPLWPLQVRLMAHGLAA
ncbi:tetratricopeptide repeat-containing sulfotransferase family protein [Cognatilysobacter segetis]|uniref:tetratricopeptide repeat-containing sulfotransferase family protein n=1 Tax=Cognatilysobacter segetis TaxID=2492394 RepID=UPI00105CF1AD|nr:sulfotransferase [Lysobacter segetis]